MNDVLGNGNDISVVRKFPSSRNRSYIQPLQQVTEAYCLTAVSGMSNFQLIVNTAFRKRTISCQIPVQESGPCLKAIDNPCD
jgi:hypothetical protein